MILLCQPPEGWTYKPGPLHPGCFKNSFAHGLASLAEEVSTARWGSTRREVEGVQSWLLG
jgi:hypothetical protein